MATHPTHPSHQPTKPTGDGVARQDSQRDRRFLDTFHDQHKHARFPMGRPWSGYREYAANPQLGHQPGFLQVDLMQGDHEDPFNSTWVAPWIPEMNGGQQSFYEFDYHRKRIRIRYDHIIGHDQGALDRYYQAAAKLAGANGWGEVVYGVVPKYQITSLIGLPSRSPKIAQAAQAGDPWLLGFIEEPNVEIAKLLGLSSSGFAMPREVSDPVVTVGQVLATPSQDIGAMIEQAVAKAMAERDARDAEKKAADKARMANVRAAKRGNGTASKAGSHAA